MNQKVSLFLCLYAILELPSASSFNVDLNTPLVLQPPVQRDIQFGYTLTHIINGTERTLLVGAPKATTVQDVETPGALYSCSLEGDDNQCHQLAVDSRMMDDKYKSWINKDLKEHQRLGYSLAASNQSSVVVCAPRWHAFYETSPDNLIDIPVGICFRAKAPEFKFEAFSPSLLSIAGINDTLGRHLIEGMTHKVRHPIKVMTHRLFFVPHHVPVYVMVLKGLTPSIPESVPNCQEYRKPSYQNNGSCQVGMSVAYAKDGGSFSLGSPGCWTWQGDTWKVNQDALEDKRDYRRVKELQLNDIGLTYDRGAQGFKNIADVYLGYSVTSLTYAEKPVIASAMPRGISTNELKVNEKGLVFGPVVFLLGNSDSERNKLTILDIIKPPLTNMSSLASTESLFSYFGYSLAAADFNGDGLDDVIVGAPFYHNKTSYDQGAIFVYYQNRFKTGGEVQWAHEMKEENDAPRRMGIESYGRFGSCVAVLGDIDSDGYQDVAVGAPFLKDGGAVFIYLGSKSGLEETYRQVIRASDLPSTTRPVNGFGISISENLRGKSLRGIEVAIGAFNSDMVAVFRTKEVITLEWSLTFDGLMDLGKEECFYTTDAGIMRYPCVEARVCLSYRKRESYTLTRQSLVFAVTLNADINHSTKRLFFDNGNSKTDLPMVLQEGVEECQTLNIMANKDIGDEVKPFIVLGEVKFEKQDKDQVILDPRLNLRKEEQLGILVRCEGAEARLCQSELQLSYKVLKSYELYSQSEIEVAFTVENSGEPAYNTRLVIMTDGDLSTRNTEGNVTCEMKDAAIICDVEVIFERDAKMSFKVPMTPTTKFFNSLKTHENHFNVNATLISSSNIVEPDKASKVFDIPITVNGTLDLTKELSNPQSVKYNSSSYFKIPSKAETEEELGPEVFHTYKIFNRNKYSVYTTRVTIKWPLKIDGFDEALGRHYIEIMTHKVRHPIKVMTHMCVIRLFFVPHHVFMYVMEYKGNYLLYLIDTPNFQGAKPFCNYSDGMIDEFNLKRLDDQLVQGVFKATTKLKNARNPSTATKNIEYMKFKCIFYELPANGEILITLRSRFVQRTIGQNEIGSTLDEVKSEARVQVLELPASAPKPLPTPKSSIATIIFGPEFPAYEVPWWVYLVAALGGLLLLVVIILILWKCGFFKRKRADGADGAEKPEGDAKDEPEKKADEEEGDEEETMPLTPESPMLKETERANDDFEFSKVR